MQFKEGMLLFEFHFEKQDYNKHGEDKIKRFIDELKGKEGVLNDQI